jgi:hypothetical protein
MHTFVVCIVTGDPFVQRRLSKPGKRIPCEVSCSSVAVISMRSLRSPAFDTGILRSFRAPGTGIGDGDDVAEAVTGVGADGGAVAVGDEPRALNSAVECCHGIRTGLTFPTQSLIFRELYRKAI